MTVTYASIGLFVRENMQFEDITWGCFTCYILDTKSNWLIKRIISRIIHNETSSKLQHKSKMCNYGYHSHLLRKERKIMLEPWQEARPEVRCDCAFYSLVAQPAPSQTWCSDSEHITHVTVWLEVPRGTGLQVWGADIWVQPEWILLLCRDSSCQV